MSGTVYGITVKVTERMYEYPELRSAQEEMGREAFRHRYEFEPTSLHWYYEEPYVWEDPETGERFDIPGAHILLIEGMQ